ncbi:MAG TPA: GAF domain-containing protein, partial [Burkholderiaceae bacterium]|nr:GAF domain-containing protein [Burkholderiaceae bacterium]
EGCGDVRGRIMVATNLASAFAEMGLYRHARRLSDANVKAMEQVGVSLGTAFLIGSVILWMIEMGDVAAARALWPRYDALIRGHSEAVTGRDHVLSAAELALAEGRAADAEGLTRAALRRLSRNHAGERRNLQLLLARALFHQGQVRAAARAARRAADIHRSQNYARTSHGHRQDIWWWLSRALRADGQAAASWAALQRAYALMLEGVRNVHDDGLRRSYLSKVATNREIVRAWLHEARARGLSDARRLAHLSIASDPGEPFKRLIDTGTRLNELRSDAALHEFLIDEITELSGAERVLLVLEHDGERRVVGAHMPPGEAPADLLRAITPWLDEARRTRALSLRHGPDGAEAVDQRSCLIAPLIAQNEVLGFIYADLEGAFGRFGPADRGLLAMLASQAAVAVANVQWAQGLEAKVAERTAELQAQRTQAEQRATELAVINSVQQGIAGSLDFRSIVDLVGDKLREVFRTNNLGIRWADRSTEPHTIHYLYEIEHGVRLHPKPHPLNPDSPFVQAAQRGEWLITGTREAARAVGIRPMPGTDESQSSLFVPILAGRTVMGGIIIEDYERRHAYDQNDARLLMTVASSMGVALENARLFNETQEALERQTATAEVLRVISGSPTDTQPVFDAILSSATRLCDAETGILFAHRDGEFQAIATRIPDPEFASIFERPLRPGPKTGLGRLVTDKRPVHIPDVLDDDAYREGDPVRMQTVRLGKVRTWLGVPMLKDGELTGAVVIYRKEQRPFAEQQISLLQTFADQAVIAIQNTRLFNETQEALARQTATADGLKAISRSTFDLPAVLNTLIGTAAKLCRASLGVIFRVEGDLCIAVGLYGASQEVVDHLAAHPPSLKLRDGVTARAAASGQPAQVVDAAADASYERADVRRLAGYRTVLGVPILREGVAIGVLSLGRAEAQAFSEKEIELVTSFADQAAIAMENVRLFNETKESLLRQSATAEVLHTISGSLTDTQPVFERIAEHAARLTGADYGMVYRFDGQLIHVTATFGVNAQGVEAARRLYPMPPGDGSVTAMAIRDGRVAMVPDVFELSPQSWAAQSVARSTGYRSVLSVPMLHDGATIGAVTVMRPVRGTFPDKAVDLLKTFGSQAVIAIQNARLFNETKEALEQQTATAEVLQVISSSVADSAPVFDKILDSCRHLFAIEQLGIFLLDDDGLIHAAAWRGSAIDAVVRTFPKPLDETITSRVIRTRQPVHVPD